MKAKFEDICRKSQKGLKKYVKNQLKETHENVISEDGFVYAQGKFPVLLVAHLDTVHTNLPTTIIHDGDKISSPNGIGGDDRCGVYMILEIIKKYHCSVLFCEDEEIGCIGAEKFTKTDLARELQGQFNYIIEFDRRNANDAVFYDCANEEFEEFITKEYFVTADGIFSDISTIAPYLGCAAVNLSCGYYKAHTKEEYVVFSEMEKNIKEAMKILARTTDEKFEYVEAIYRNYEYGGWYGYYGADDGEGYYTILFLDYNQEEDLYETYAHSRIEAIGAFCMDNQYSCVADIIDIVCDAM